MATAQGARRMAHCSSPHLLHASPAACLHTNVSGRLSFDFSPRALPSCPLFSSPPFTSPTFTANSFSSPACPFSPPVSPSFLPSCLRVRTPCPSSRLSPLLHLPLLPTSALLLRPLPPLLLPLASHPRFPFPSLRLPSLLRHPFPFHVAARRHCPHLRKPPNSMPSVAL
ncbi:unnamed protein product [Closterium sp. NIES-65]|nr:unnamed protein product [Closterium sp. NIES-65]